MRKKLLTLSLLFSAMTLFAQLRNPVIPGFHPCPSTCRVGDDFYLTNASSQYFPGIPVYHSKDLVNWELIGNALDRESQVPLKDATSKTGIFAPTIRYHEGRYYIVSTNVGNGGTFLVTATDPKGPWSEPIWLKQQGIDPSLLFEDGKCYMVSNPDNTIMLCEINPKTGEQLTPSKPLWQGTGERYPEAPHLYKKDGWYYLLISEGGTEIAHRLSIARSRNIYGPYQSHPKNPILTHCTIQGQLNMIQATGHGDFIQAKDGSWWLTFLGYREFETNFHHLGRETFLAPVEWNKGQWPIVNGGKPVDTLMQVKTLPLVPVKKKQTYYDFHEPFGPEWIYIQNPVTRRYMHEGGQLRLLANKGSLTKNSQPTFIGIRQEHPRILVETRVDFSESSIGDEAGLTVYQIHDGHAELCLISTKGRMIVAVKGTLKRFSAILASDEIEGYEATLRIRSDEKQYYFDYAVDGTHFKTLFKIDCSMLSTEALGGFTGVTLGMYTTKKEDEGATIADFEYFKYEEN